MATTVTARLEEAIALRAQDIYYFPTETGYSIQVRCSSGVEEVDQVSPEAGACQINYLKFQANMGLAEHRRPQLGAWIYESSAGVVFCRLSTVGDFRGRESLVIRLIYTAKLVKPAYLVESQWQTVLAASRARGMVLFAGPMGSGKTSSLYYLAKRMTDKKVLAIEDPIEIYEPRFLQLQVNDLAQMSYSALLKVALRHHPDVLIIGEIRDEQTAQAALNAALSGHLVLATVHAKSAAGVVARLLNLGLNRGDLLQALTLVAYQRLLPAKAGPAVLFDCLTQADLVDLKEEDWLAASVTSQWKEDLNAALKDGKISPAVAARFEDG